MPAQTGTPAAMPWSYRSPTVAICTIQPFGTFLHQHHRRRRARLRARCQGGGSGSWPPEPRPRSDPPLAASNLVFLGPADSPPAGQPLGPPNEWVPLAPSDHPSSPPPAWAPLPLVPWDLATTATVLALWLLGFWCLAYGALPCALALAGLDPGSPAPVFQALRHLALDVAQLALTLGLLGRALREHAPRARGLFALRALPLSDWVGPALAGAATFPAIHAVHRLAVALTVPGVPAPGGGGGDAAARALLGSGDGATRALWFFMLAACAPVWEEAMFRGFLLPSLATHMPRWAAVLASAAVFACVHFSRENFLPLLLLGCVFGAAYSHRANLLPCILLHSLWNVFLLVSVCGF
ncbi:CPLD6 [Auxenochlorella protothecoides x Auxenochlorella symbiontica]